MPITIPKKFTKLKKSFVERLSSDIGTSALSSFCAFPPGVSFHGQESKEDVILLVRRHPIVLLPQLLLSIVLLSSPFLVFPILKTVLGINNVALWMGVSILFVILAITVVIDTYFKWFYTVNIITDERVLDVNFNNILYHQFVDAQLEKIEEVSHKPVGIFSSIFDYGDVFIQTAGAKPEIVFNSVPRPRDVHDTLSDLLELKQEGKI